MDPLTAHDLEIARQTPPAKKLVQALELMEAGIRLKRAALRQACPEAADRAIDEALDHWLLGDA